MGDHNPHATAARAVEEANEFFVGKIGKFVDDHGEGFSIVCSHFGIDPC